MSEIEQIHTQRDTLGYHLTATKKVTPFLEGIDAFGYTLSGKWKRRKKVLRKLLKEAKEIDTLIDRTLSDEELKRRVLKMKSHFRRRGKDDSAYLHETLALLQEAAYRTLGLRPYPVQIAGALGLYSGLIVEMATGEGKTLTASLTAIIRGWSGLPCHLITANDYLASRDAEKLSPLYTFCDVTVGSVTSTASPAERKTGYFCDVTYTTPKEVVADFLRDRLALGAMQVYERRRIKSLFAGDDMIASGTVMRGIHFAIVDEADSVLIDEAVTPLIISRNQPNSPFIDACMSASEVAKTLREGEHYSLDRQYKEVELAADIPIKKLVNSGAISRKFSGVGFQKELLRQALIAKEFFIRDKQYVVQDDKVLIVDEFTGRVMPQRTWSAGLHQLIEAKEEVTITPPNETLARLSFQHYYRLYHHIGGMTGTGKEASAELWHVYDLPVIPIPSNRPSQRVIKPLQLFLSEQEKWEAIVSEIVSIHTEGRPVLVGTRSVEMSEFLSGKLKEANITCSIINAVRHEDEAEIIARAGGWGAVTVATNMAGRGTDIEIPEEVNNLGGLHVIASEPHESGRVDRQLFGRSARQGDSGSAILYASLDDELMRRYLFSPLLYFGRTLLKTKLPFIKPVVKRVVFYAQKKAEKRAYHSRKMVQKTDKWLEDSLSFSQQDVSA